MPSHRWPDEFKARVLAWIDESPTRGPADAARHFTGAALDEVGKPLPIPTVRRWVRVRSGEPDKPSNSAEAQRERRQRAKRARMELVQGGRTGQGSERGRGEGGEVVQGPRPAAEPTVPGVDERLFSDDPVERLEAQLEAIGQDIVEAKVNRQGNVVAKLRGMFVETARELDEARRAARDKSGTLETMTEEEYLEQVAEVAADTPDPYLEVYVREYLQRHKLKLAR